MATPNPSASTPGGASTADNPVVNGTAVRGLLNPTNCALCLIDHQAPMALAVQSIDRQMLVNNVAGLARVGKLFELPTVITTIAAADQNGPNFTQILEVFPDTAVIDRQNINAWEEPRFVAAVEATGRRKLVVAALWTEVCLVMPALSAMADGYEVYVVGDASGGTSVTAHETAIERCVQAGAVPVTWIQVMLELQRAWTHTATTAGVSEITLAYGGGYGLDIYYANTMVHPKPGASNGGASNGGSSNAGASNGATAGNGTAARVPAAAGR